MRRCMFHLRWHVMLFVAAPSQITRCVALLAGD